MTCRCCIARRTLRGIGVHIVLRHAFEHFDKRGINRALHENRAKDLIRRIEECADVRDALFRML